jgi:hypothetical protein
MSQFIALAKADHVTLGLSVWGKITITGERENVLEWQRKVLMSKDQVLAELSAKYFDDGRRLCTQCRNYSESGVCRVARPGSAVSGIRGFRPAIVLWRCAGFEPINPDDPPPTLIETVNR